MECEIQAKLHSSQAFFGSYTSYFRSFSFGNNNCVYHVNILALCYTVFLETEREVKPQSSQANQMHETQSGLVQEHVISPNHSKTTENYFMFYSPQGIVAQTLYLLFHLIVPKGDDGCSGHRTLACHHCCVGSVLVSGHSLYVTLVHMVTEVFTGYSVFLPLPLPQKCKITARWKHISNK